MGKHELDEIAKAYKSAWEACNPGREMTIEKRGGWYACRERVQFSPVFKKRGKQLEAMTKELEQRFGKDKTNDQ